MSTETQEVLQDLIKDIDYDLDNIYKYANDYERGEYHAYQKLRQKISVHLSAAET